jgi:hypothetical protein
MESVFQIVDIQGSGQVRSSKKLLIGTQHNHIETNCPSRQLIGIARDGRILEALLAFDDDGSDGTK